MDIHAVLASSITDKVALEEFVEALKFTGSRRCFGRGVFPLHDPWSEGTG